MPDVNSESFILLSCNSWLGRILVRNFQKESIKMSDDLFDLLENAEKNLSEDKYQDLVTEVKLNHQELRKEIEVCRLDALKKKTPSKSDAGSNA